MKNNQPIAIIGKEKKEIACIINYFFEKRGIKNKIIEIDLKKDSLGEKGFGMMVLSTVKQSEQLKTMFELLEKMPKETKLIFNYDSEEMNRIYEMDGIETFTFGLDQGANLRADNLKFGHKTNFKIHYKGNVVPIWAKSVLTQEQIYATLAATAVALEAGINLVEISQDLVCYPYY